MKDPYFAATIEAVEQRFQSFEGGSADADADSHPDIAAALDERSQAVGDMVDAGTLHERDSGSERRPSTILQSKVELVSETGAVRLQEQGGHGDRV